MTHTHTTKTSRDILGNALSECSCGARKWDNDKAILGATLDTDGWYVAKKVVEAEDNTYYEMLQTEGYGYGKDANDLLDSHTPNID